MKVVDRTLEISSTPQIISPVSKDADIKRLNDEGSASIYLLTSATTSEPLLVKWRIPAVDIKGVWTSNALLDKRIRADWELPQVSSRVSVDAPVITLFSHEDQNVMTIAASDVINTLHFEAAIQEEDNHIHCAITFFSDDVVHGEDYACEIRIDQRNHNFSAALQDAGRWLEEKMGYEVMEVPEHARVPLYSTWYSYHQNFTEDHLLNECRKSSEMGYKLIIVDDGWQTMDGGRGYDYTGDWEPDRLADVSGFVQRTHDLDMKVMFWYSVPFCGKKSKAYQRFRGKFLTESHPWAPVFDPRFPEVREYLVSRYVVALRDWGIDGFKLDFIDDFRVYPETEVATLGGRDTLSVNHGVEKLIVEIREALISIKADVLIEFRQKYISPMLRHLGNMFRAFDCPYDSVMNRVRTTDVRLLCGNSAVHSDMLTWHKDEPVEFAAVQFASILFSVPQLSVKLDEMYTDHLAMISHYTSYWEENKSILLDGKFTAMKPLGNYSILKTSLKGKCIYGVYEDICLHLDGNFREVDIVNGMMGERIIIETKEFSAYYASIMNCQGKQIEEKELKLTKGIHSLAVPAGGMILLKKM